jgi:hypothetical protein
MIANMERVSTSTLYLIPGIGLPPIDLRTWSNRRGRPSDKPLMRLGDQKENTTNFRKARTMFQASILTATHEFPCFFFETSDEYPIVEILSERNEALLFHRHHFPFASAHRTVATEHMTFFCPLFLSLLFPRHFICMHRTAFQREPSQRILRIFID